MIYFNIEQVRVGTEITLFNISIKSISSNYISSLRSSFILGQKESTILVNSFQENKFSKIKLEEKIILLGVKTTKYNDQYQLITIKYSSINTI